MSAGGVIGAVIGFVVSGGTPQGAVYGYQVNCAAGALLDDLERSEARRVHGPRISEIGALKGSAAIPREEFR